MGLCGEDDGRDDGGLRLLRGAPAPLRADGALLPRGRRDHGHRGEGDVHLFGPRRAQRDAASGRHGGDGARRAGERAVCPGDLRQALVLGPHVPLRAPPEGALPSVPSDRHGVPGGVRGGGGRRGHRPLRGDLPASRPEEPGGCPELRRLPRLPSRLPPGAAGPLRGPQARALRDLPGTHGTQSPAHPGLQEPLLRGRGGRRPGHLRPPLPGVPGPLQGGPGRTGAAGPLLPTGQKAGARAGLLHQDGL